MNEATATSEQPAIRPSAAASTLYLVPYGTDRIEEGRRLASCLVGGADRDASLAQRGAHPDVIELAPPAGKERIGIDQVRDVIRQAQFAPVQGDRKVCLIAQSEALTPEAGNALLKVMEEPPRDLAFVLLAEHPSDLLPTIVSRSRLVRIAPPDAEMLRTKLESAGYSPEDAERLARWAPRNRDLAPFLESRIDLDRQLDTAARELQEATILDLIAACTGNDALRRREALLLLLSKAAEGDGELLTVGIRALGGQERDTISRLLQDLLALCFELLSSRFATNDKLGERASAVRERVGAPWLHDLCEKIEDAYQSLVVYGPLEGILLALLLPEGAEHAD